MMSEGTLSINGANVEIKEIDGTGYFKGDTAFWTKSASAAAAQSPRASGSMRQSPTRSFRASAHSSVPRPS